MLKNIEFHRIFYFVIKGSKSVSIDRFFVLATNRLNFPAGEITSMGNSTFWTNAA